MSRTEQSCKWYFAESRGGMEQGPNDAMSETFKKVPYDALVRESIQNSLDAVADVRQPVVMDFNFGKINAIDYGGYYDLQKHILGCIQKYNNDSARKKFQPMSNFFSRQQYGMTYLSVSDSNTKGMEYDKKHPESSSFYSFVKCAGNSVKSNSDSGGSFGFGKAAYFNISKIRSLLISTQVIDGRNFFEGVASLCTHKYDNFGNYQPVGYYCDNENENPVMDIEAIPRDFRRNQPGTTVFIMGIDTKENPVSEIVEEIAKAAIFNFWCAILHSKLVVRINESSIVIDSSNVEVLAEKYYPSFDEEAKHNITRNPRPYIDAVAHADEDNKHVRIKMQLKRLGECSLYVLKRKVGTDNILYMRSPRMLVFNKKNKTQIGFYAVFLCHNRTGNELLKSIEDPSHREWEWKRLSTEEKSVQVKAREAMKEMRDSIKEELEKLFASSETDKIDIIGLEDYLYIPTEYDEDNDESDISSDTGMPTGKLLDESTSMTTEIDDTPSIEQAGPNVATSDTLIIKKSQSATPKEGGKLKSGHGEKPRKGAKSGVPMPGRMEEDNTPDDDGTSGLYAMDIEVPYRSFSQVEAGEVVHYVVLRSPTVVEKLQLRFYTVGEDDSVDPIQLVNSDKGTIDGHLLENLSLAEGSNKIRVRFNDNMKHSIKLKTQELVKL